METKLGYRQSTTAFTLIELLTVVAAVAIISAVSIAAITGSSGSLKSSQLEQDVSRLNTAVNVFISSGGSLDGFTTAQGVITELKKEADATGQKQVVGLRGSMVDKRLEAIDETDSDRRPRAIWRSALNKFVIEDSTDGVREFRMNEALASIDYGSAPRNTKLVYNETDGWVWETTDYQIAFNTGPSAVPTINAPTLGAGGGGGGANTTKLGTPSINPGSGTLSLASFPLQVTITKAETDPADAKIFCSVEPNVWLTYDSPITVDPGTSIQAYTSNGDPNMEDSDPATATFANDPEILEIALSIPKNPINFAEAGGPLEPGDYTPLTPVGPISVSLPSGANIPDVYENSDNFQIFWTYDGSDPRSSASRVDGGTFSDGYSSDSIDYGLAKWDGASLLPIQVVAQSNNPSVVTNAPVLSSNIGISRTNLRQPAIAYESDTSRGDIVELSKIVDFGDMPVGARIYYTTDGTDPGDDGSANPLTGTLYTGPFDPLVDDEEATQASIVARVYPPQEHAAWFNVSQPSGSTYTVADWEISGVASGGFSNAVGPSGMVSNIWGSQTSSYFQWGDPGNWGTGANWLSFAGMDFTDVSANERFQVGQLSYYNGTISMSSLATAVDFAVELAFGGTANQFDYTFDLLTTSNDGTAWENADYVWFNDTRSAQNISLYGADYSLNLEFGATSSAGFSSLDQFHVLEGQSASASIYATLVSLGSWW